MIFQSQPIRVHDVQGVYNDAEGNTVNLPRLSSKWHNVFTVIYSVQETIYKCGNENKLQGGGAGRVDKGQECGGRVLRMLPNWSAYWHVIWKVLFCIGDEWDGS